MLITYSVIDMSHFSGLGIWEPFCWLLDNACFCFNTINK